MEVYINEFDHFGNGIAKVDNKVVFVKRALPLETVDVKINKNKKNYMYGEIVKILKNNPNRIVPICPYYNECGGCNFLHVSKSLENEFKLHKAQELLDNVDMLYETCEFNYRNKVTLHVKDKSLGFYQEGTNNLINIDYCYLVNERINEVIKELHCYLDNNLHEISKVVIKVATDQLMLVVFGKVTNNFIKYFSDVDTIVVDNEIIFGKGYLEEKIDGMVFMISPDSFFQVNKLGLIKIRDIIYRYLENINYHTCLDLYSGTSLWGILISNYFDKVISIECNKEATEDAKINQFVNKASNLEIICGKVEDYIDRFKNIDVIIVDPPRSGLDHKTCQRIKKINPQIIIYVSCDMLTLKRDIDILKGTYDVKESNIIDMFPKTYHVECVSILKRH